MAKETTDDWTKLVVGIVVGAVAKELTLLAVQWFVREFQQRQRQQPGWPGA